MPETKLRDSELISLAEKISRQPNTDSVLWLLGITFM